MARRVLKGEVVRKSGDKTISVRVVSTKKHEKYLKIYRTEKKYLAHDPENKYKKGDVVEIEESRPISRLKKWLAQ